jgi:flagellin
MKQAAVNAQDGVSFIQTTEGALGEIHSILHRVRELSIQAANGLYTKSDRKTIQVEVKQLMEEIDRIARDVLVQRIEHAAPGDISPGSARERKWRSTSAPTPAHRMC